MHEREPFVLEKDLQDRLLLGFPHHKGQDFAEEILIERAVAKNEDRGSYGASENQIRSKCQSLSSILFKIS